MLYFLATVTKVAVDMDVPLSLWQVVTVSASLPRSDTVGSYCVVFLILRNLQTDFHVAILICSSTKVNNPHHFQQLLLDMLMIVIL